MRPLTAKDLNERDQVDLVDMQTMKDGGYTLILHYVEYLTKFHVIRPLKSKTACEVAHELLMIFFWILEPHIYFSLTMAASSQHKLLMNCHHFGQN